MPTVRNLTNIISRPGANNDLIDLNHLAVPLAQATVGGQFGEPLLSADGAQRPGAFIVSTPALRQSVPELAVARPYAVDLTGWFEGYSHPGAYDANGAASRIALTVGLGSIKNGVLNILGSNPLSNLLTDPSGRGAFASSVLTTGQGDRCPGSMERGPTAGHQRDPRSSRVTPAARARCRPGNETDPRQRRGPARRRSVPGLHAGVLERHRAAPPTRSSSTTRSGWSPAPTSRSPA